jgi:PIN domain nuclease of toxin-antitoxin system
LIALLDTHAFLWAAIEPGRLSAAARAIISDPANEIHLSLISLWEISLKFALGKLAVRGGRPDDLVPAAHRMGLVITPPSAEEAIGFHRLSRAAHKDPFDRMLVWQCLQRNWVFVTRDRAFEAYRNLGLKTAW